MQLFCNGERVEVEADLLADAVAALGYGESDRPTAKVVVAVNETFVAKADWPSYRLRADDRLDILAAMQGG